MQEYELWADRDLGLIARVEDDRQVSPVTVSGQGPGVVKPSIDGEAGADCSTTDVKPASTEHRDHLCRREGMSFVS